MSEVRQCSSCGADIIWVVMVPSGKRMPLDAKPEKRVIVVDGEGWIRDTYTSHFATCPHAMQHRRPK